MTTPQYFSVSVYHYKPISSLAQPNSCPELWWPEATVSMCRRGNECVYMLKCASARERERECMRQRSAGAEGWQTVYLSVTEQFLVNLAPSSPAIIIPAWPCTHFHPIPLFLTHTPAKAWKYGLCSSAKIHYRKCIKAYCCIYRLWPRFTNSLHQHKPSCGIERWKRKAFKLFMQWNVI